MAEEAERRTSGAQDARSECSPRAHGVRHGGDRIRSRNARLARMGRGTEGLRPGGPRQKSVV